MYYLNKKYGNYEMSAVVWKNKNRDYATLLKSAVNFLVA
jgi:hypothetical protein